MNDTLFAGRLITVTLLDGTTAEFKVHQLSLAQYERAFALLDDEITLTAFICGHDLKWAENLKPESYEQVYAVAQEVNARGFFVWSQRRKQREQVVHERNLAAMAQLPPEVVKLAMQVGSASSSPSGSPGPQPR